MSIARRYGYRVVAAWFVVALLASVWADLTIGSARPAAADEASNKSSWVDENSSLVFSTCNQIADLADSLRSDFFGTMAGQIGVGPALGFVSPLAVGGGAAVGSGSAVTGTSSAVGAFVGGGTAVGVVGGAAAIGLTVAVCGKSLNEGIRPMAKLGAGSYLGTQPVAGGPVVGWGQIVTNQECPSGSSGTAKCVRFMWDQGQAGSTLNYANTWRTGQVSSAPGYVFAGNGYPTQSGNAAGKTYWDFAGSSSLSGFVDIRIECGTDPTCYQTHESSFGLNVGLNGYAPGGGPEMSVGGANWWTTVTGETWKGQKRRLVATTSCKVPGGTTTEVAESSPEFWDSDKGPGDWLPTGCPIGKAVTRQLVVRERVGGGETAVTVSDFSVPASIVGNATSLQCWVKGVTSCPMVELPNGNVGIGGATGVEQAATAGQTLRATVTDVLEIPAASSFPDPPATTTTVPQATTTTVPQATTTTVAEPECPEAAGCPGQEDPPEGSSAECWPSGWGWFNPAEWVLKPIKCALVWAFWDGDVADEVSALGAEHGWTQLVSDSSISTSATAGPCIDFETWTAVCTSAVTDVEMPSGVTSVLVAAVLFFGLFEVIGLFARITGGS